MKPSPFTSLSAKRQQRGATLIEILVAVMILSFGMLGMAALQSRALQGNAASVQKSQALMLNTMMLDSMRIDREQAKNASYNTTGLVSGTALSGTTLADINRKFWIERAIAMLGSGVSVTGIINCTNAYVCTVTLQWDDSKRSTDLDNTSSDKQKVTLTSTI